MPSSASGAAALNVYLHGMTAETADRDVGRGGIGALHRILDDPSFPVATTSSPSSPTSAAPNRHPSWSAFSNDLRPARPRSRTTARCCSCLTPWDGSPRAGDRGALDALLSLTAQDAALTAPGSAAEVCDAAIAGLALAGAAEAHVSASTRSPTGESFPTPAPRAGRPGAFRARVPGRFASTRRFRVGRPRRCGRLVHPRSREPDPRSRLDVHQPRGPG